MKTSSIFGGNHVFTVGYRDFPRMVADGEVRKPRPTCRKCGSWMEVRTETFTNKKGEVVTIPEGDCLVCGSHVWNLNFATASNPTGVTRGAFEAAKVQEDPKVSEEEIYAVEVVTKVRKEKRVLKTVRKEGMSTLDRLLMGK